MIEISLSKDTMSDKIALAKYLTVHYDYDKIADILEFKEPMPFTVTDKDGLCDEKAEAERTERFNNYMRDYNLDWGTYFDIGIAASVTHECAIAFRGSLLSFQRTDNDVVIEDNFQVVNSFADYKVRIPYFWTILKLDDDFALATFHHPTQDFIPTTKEEEQCVVLGRTRTIIHMLADRCNYALATNGEEWFSDNFKHECAQQLDQNRDKFINLAAIPGKAGCKCNKLIKNVVWRLADTVSDVIR